MRGSGSIGVDLTRGGRTRLRFSQVIRWLRPVVSTSTAFCKHVVGEAEDGAEHLEPRI